MTAPQTPEEIAEKIVNHFADEDDCDFVVSLLKSWAAQVTKEKDMEIQKLKEAAEMEFQRADGKAEMKRWFQEQLSEERAKTRDLIAAIDKFINPHVRRQCIHGIIIRSIDLVVLEEAVSRHKTGAKEKS